MITELDLLELKRLKDNLEDVYWRFYDMETPEDDDESAYGLLWQSMEDWLSNVQF